MYKISQNFFRKIHLSVSKGLLQTTITLNEEFFYRLPNLNALID